MPNWCNNSLKITGDKTTRKQFIAKAGGLGIDLTCFFPAPVGTVDECNWCRDNWDTKWPPQDYCHTPTLEEDFLGFDTAWSPPIGLIANISAQFPALKFHLKYMELGVGCCGETFFCAGEVDDNEYDWDSLKGRSFRADNFYDGEEHRQENEEGFEDN